MERLLQVSFSTCEVVYQPLFPCTVNVAGDRGQRLIDLLTLYQRVKEDASLLLVPFNTLFDYAHLLKALSVSLQ